MTRYCDKNDLSEKEVSLDNLSHVMKEEKMGLYKGVKARMKMYVDIVKSINSKV